jgi:hypothetical protein
MNKLLRFPGEMSVRVDVRTNLALRPVVLWTIVALVNKMSVNDQAQALVFVPSLALCRDYWHLVRRHSVSSSSLPPRDGGDPLPCPPGSRSFPILGNILDERAFLDRQRSPVLAAFGMFLLSSNEAITGPIECTVAQATLRNIY